MDPSWEKNLHSGQPQLIGDLGGVMKSAMTSVGFGENPPGRGRRGDDEETTHSITPPETNSEFIPENRPYANRKGSSFNHPFSGVFAVSFREGSFKFPGGSS